MQATTANGEVRSEQETSAALPPRTEELAGFLAASLDSMTPALVQRMVITMAQMAELIDYVNSDEMKSLLARTTEVAESLERSLESIKALEESGALKALVEMGEFAHAMKQSMTSSILTRSLTNMLTLAELGDQMLEIVRESADEARSDKRKISARAVVKDLTNPELQEGMKTLVALGRRLPRLLEGF